MFTVTLDGQLTIAGAKLSTTVTVAVQVEVLLNKSFKVNVTVFAPKLLQLKVLGETVLVIEVQLSKLPLSTSFGTILALPFASNATVYGLQIAVGADESTKNKLNIAVSLLPQASSTAILIILEPPYPITSVAISFGTNCVIVNELQLS